LFIAARNSHLRAFENVSRLPDAMSDHFCRLATGGGLRLRKLFKDSEEIYFRGARPVAFEGITNVVARPDLQDRAIISQLEELPEFKTLDELDPAFEHQRPAILGALLDMIVRGLEMLPVAQAVRGLPRMADFTKWACACLGGEPFETAYADNRANAIAVMLSHDPLAKALRALMKGRKKPWTGIMEDLLDIVGPETEIKSTKRLSDDLRRLMPSLRTVGVHVVFEQRTGEARPFRIELRK
jgi:putative DNA primase/helicase